MTLKLLSLGRGASGVQWAIVETLERMLAAGVTPAVPAQGSVGASGDLAPLAHLTAVLIGEGRADYRGERLPGGAAMQAAGIEPVVLRAKEGLAMINGTQCSTALALAGLFDAKRLLRAALVTGALSVDATLGSDTPFDPEINALRGHPAQIDVAAALRTLLAGSEIRASHVDCTRVQDPYSVRCQPQVMGACLTLLRQAGSVLAIEAVAATDNPLVLPERGEILSGGNFHAEPVAFAADQIALAVSEIGALAERRIALLVDPSMSELPAFLTPDPGVNSGFMAAEITAAALAAENKQRAAPASIDSLTTCANQEDHVSMATHAARRLTEMNDNLGKDPGDRMAGRRPGHRVPRAPENERPPRQRGRAVARRRAAARRGPLYGAGHRGRRRPCARRRARRSRGAGRDAGLVSTRPAPERPGPSRTDIAALADRLRAGETRALARALTLADIGGEEARKLLQALEKDRRETPVIGLTGPPGSGKSTLISAVIRTLRARDMRVAALAVDPSSPKSGGAILGDRVRMGEHGSDPHVFIRSIAARGHLGGLALNIQASIDVLNAADFDIVLLETVGAGQSEIEVAQVADVTVVISAPGLGDDLQAIKAGILEVADILAVNKADLPGADATAQQLESMLSLRSARRRDTPVVSTVATTGEGVAGLVDAAWRMAGAITPEERTARAERQAVDRLANMAGALVRDRLKALPAPERRALLEQIRAGAADPADAVRRLLKE